MTAVPWATPVTEPEDETDATEELLLDHVIVRPVSALPSASRGVALSCSTSPSRMSALDGVSCTEATAGGMTFTDAVPTFDAPAAMISVEPTFFVETLPFASTTAIVVSWLDQVTD